VGTGGEACFPQGIHCAREDPPDRPPSHSRRNRHWVRFDSQSRIRLRRWRPQRLKGYPPAELPSKRSSLFTMDCRPAGRAAGCKSLTRTMRAPHGLEFKLCQDADTDPVCSQSWVQVSSPQWHSNIRTVDPNLGSIIL